MDLGVRWHGFLIPLAIVHSQTRRMSGPGRGKCVECDTKRERTYIRWDDKPYCENCIQFDIAEADPSDEMKLEQRHPEAMPVEIMHEKIKSVLPDEFTERAAFWEAAFK